MVAGVVVAPLGMDTSISAYSACLCEALARRLTFQIVPPSALGTVAKQKPAFVLIEHSFGIYYDLRSWESAMDSLRDIPTFVRLHSVYRKHRCNAALDAIPDQILVHTQGQKDLLTPKLPNPITVIPHGCWEIVPKEIVTETVICQFGFAKTYKGWDSTLRIFKHLPKHMKLKLLMAKSPDCPSDEYVYERVKKEAEGENVEVLFDFWDEQELRAEISRSSLVLLPYIDYKHENVLSASGAARLALSCSVPLITSKIPMFEDLVGVCVQVENEEQAVAEALRLLTDPFAAKEQTLRQTAYARKFSFDEVAGLHAESLSCFAE